MIFHDNSAKVARQLRGPIADFVGKVALTTVRFAKLEVAGRGMIPQAVDTGRLLNSLTVQLSEGADGSIEIAGNVKPTKKNPAASQKDAVHNVSRRETAIVAVVGSNVDYAPHIELGTRKMRPRPFLRNALSRTKRKFGL